MRRIVEIISLNEGKPNTCGSCKQSDNDLGIVSLRCQIIYDKAIKSDNPYALEAANFAKVRSWETCYFKPSKWEARQNSGETPT